MMKLILSVVWLGLFLSCCTTKTNQKQIEKWKQEVRETELRFSKMAGEEGIHAAFTAFAADEAVLMRNNELIKGWDNIDLHYQNQNSKGLQWSPEFVDVAASGDLAYTYGSYVYSSTDSTGKAIQTRGIFHTVWKKQADGSWKFVWD